MHLDIKPDNILLRRDNGKLVVRVADLGLSRSVAQYNACPSKTGTSGYM
jgi:serine/threonine protein kinase